MLLLWLGWMGFVTTLQRADAGCSRENPPPEGHVIYIGASNSAPSIPLDTVALFNCKSGLVLDGSETSVCKHDGDWSHAWPSCVPPTCPDPPPVAHGSIHFDPGNRTNGSKVFYKCDYGYVIKGKRFRKCKRNFTWTTVVSCVQNETLGCDAPPYVQRTKPNRLPDGRKFPIGQKLRYVCRPGYYGTGNPFIKCQVSQSWTNHSFTCYPVNCGHPGRPDHGHLDTKVFLFPTMVQFSCDLGYQLRGFSTTICQANQRWSRRPPTCTPLTCKVLEPPAKGSLDTNEISFQTRVLVSCDNGFAIKGGPERRSLVCGADGEWSDAVPECQEVDCGEFRALYNGDITYPSGTLYLANANFRCHDGYILEGDDVAYCGQNGLWSTPRPNCWGRCPRPEVANGDVYSGRSRWPTTALYYLHGEVLSVVCNNRYRKHFTLIGPSQIGCKNGTWDSDPVCKPAACQVENRPLGTFNVSSGTKVNHTGTLLRQCPVGYHLYPNIRVSVCKYGFWHPRPASCHQDPCHLPSTPAGTQYWVGSETYEDVTLRHGTIVQTRCSEFEGYVLADTSVSTFHCDRGEWTPSVLSCIGAPCRVPERPHGYFDGHQTWSTVIHNTTMMARCNDGYHPTSQKSTCLLGRFFPVPDHCQPDMCTLDLSSPGTIYKENKYWNPRMFTEITQLDHGTEISITCEGNYAMPRLAFSKVTCNAGRWSPQIVDCKYGICRLPRAPRGTLYVKRRGWIYGGDKYFTEEVDIQDGEDIELECEDGYTQTATVSCRTGEWFPRLENCHSDKPSTPASNTMGSPEAGSGGQVTSSATSLTTDTDDEMRTLSSTAQARLLSSLAPHKVTKPTVQAITQTDGGESTSQTQPQNGQACSREGTHGSFDAGPGYTEHRQTARFNCDDGYKLVDFDRNFIWTFCSHGHWNHRPLCMAALDVTSTPDTKVPVTEKAESSVTSEMLILASAAQARLLSAVEVQSHKVTKPTVPAITRTDGESTSNPQRIFQPCQRGEVFYGRFEYATGDTKHGYRELFRCDHGYKALESLLDFAWVRCDDGHWNPEPYCRPAQECQTGEVTHGYFDATESSFSEGSYVMYRCNVGYSTPENEATKNVTCADGHWSPEPVCSDDVDIDTCDFLVCCSFA